MKFTTWSKIKRPQANNIDWERKVDVVVPPITVPNGVVNVGRGVVGAG